MTYSAMTWLLNKKKLFSTQLFNKNLNCIIVANYSTIILTSDPNHNI